MDYIHHYASPLGGITLASDGSALTGLWFDGQKYFAAALSPDSEERVSPSSTVHSSSDHVLYAHWKQSDNLIASGSFGDMLWELDKKGVLNVLGSGAMGNYSYYGGIGGLTSTRPWADYYENINSIMKKKCLYRE